MAHIVYKRLGFAELCLRRPMTQLSSAVTGEFPVPLQDPMEACLYLAPEAPSLEPRSHDGLPLKPPGCARLVCISDTHNEHEGLRLPPGDILLHAGDVLTESGQRHVRRDAATREITAVHPEGEALFVKFAEWFGQLPYAYKVLIAGNHDLVLEGLGKERVRTVLRENCTHGEVVYLEDEEATVGGLRIYGSPYAHYSSRNDAFKREAPAYNIQPGVHVVMTHMPGVLPRRSRKEVHQSGEITRPMFEAGTLLYLSGHCHWAHGLHFARLRNEDPRWLQECMASAPASQMPERIPCVVASVCGSTFHRAAELSSSSGVRGDPSDKTWGGYNLVQPPLVCDVHVPSIRSAAWPVEPASVNKPPLLLFCPGYDTLVLEQLLPRLQQVFSVDHVETAADGVQAVEARTYIACVSKLGVRGNLGCDILRALRARVDCETFVAIHSKIAANDEGMREWLKKEMKVDFFTGPGSEAELLRALGPFTAQGARKREGRP